jgi:hypothetical protein
MRLMKVGVGIFSTKIDDWLGKDVPFMLDVEFFTGKN